MADSTHSLLSLSEEDLHHTEDKPIIKVDTFLSKINDGFIQSKADQILRLLKDQEDLNLRFHCCDLNSEESGSENSLSDSSVKETEQRLGLRLAVHKQRGARSKTSMGFYNESEPLSTNYSSDEDDFTMEERPNTRINRPKSSYVRRRTVIHEDSTDENMEDDSAPLRRCRSSRPQSRLGNRPDSQRNRAVLHESSYNIQVPPTSPRTDFIDQSNYDRYAHTKTTNSCVNGIQRQKSRVKGFCDVSDPSENVPQTLERQRTYQDMSANHTYSSDETRDEFSSSTRVRHRKQQLRHAKSQRPTSENVFLVRQRTEARMLQSKANVVRPKSDKTLVQQSKSKNIISIDTNPMQAAQNSGYQQTPSSSIQSSQTTSYQYGSSQQRPASRRSRQDIPVNARGTGVRAGRPIGVMKLPPLDPAVAKRAERIVLAARETCA